MTTDADSDGSGGRSQELPPSCRYVLDVLERDAPLTRQELLARTDLPEGTLDWAVGVLKNQGEVFSSRDGEDLRVVLYDIQG